jgi:hypothetical protein
MPPRTVPLHHTLVGSQVYWDATDVVTFLHRVADAWTRDQTGNAEHAVDNEVRAAVAARLNQIAVDLDAEAMQRMDWWASYRPGVPMPTEPESALPGAARVRTAVVHVFGARHLHFSSMDFSAFLRAEADRTRQEHERLFDREIAAGLTARYLVDTADQLELEALMALGPRDEPQQP